jgi:nucleoside-diphosphate-sugar epimerase
VNLVTGVPGWLGSALASSLSGQVRSLVLPGSEWSGEHVVGDLREPESLIPFFADANGATLYHCAGLVHPQKVQDFYTVNVEGTRSLLQAAEQAGVKRVVLVSSNSPVGVGRHREDIFTEESPCRPYMHYGKSKFAMEHLVTETTLETVIVRPPWFYGPSGPDRQGFFFRLCGKGLFPIIGDGANLRSMVYIDNLCHGLELCGTLPQAVGRTYWIADRRPYSFNEIVTTIQRLLEQEFGLTEPRFQVRVPHFVGELATFADGLLQSMGIYHQKIHVFGEVNKTIACSIARAERELGYKPQIELEEGMRRSIVSALEQGFKI